ncbi:DUF2336 domain-containing protein [Rhodoplanes sp. TEM]|uniref:DUF2336 domain-containing protein n=1 Tax=Rhodoplanes tepidamans TaxID=200616 RepID=A0ABT5J828_RHOTP|nr:MULTISPECIES: DUF2336 domain-containing protein [Rhodoplanes]MDC7785815.1 DUF2336 domain-containing protein [Rhodoplanes tepidamans]MDC7984082.1 DUF2336 domain-containing protein [Rhodoplanes sp. TEM]MDQ0354622.1 uncharacterized protein (DUF2336 family) [Rhodoplanes tepidamans]
MRENRTIIEELEEALSNRAIGYRAEALRRIADLFLGRAAEYDEEEVALFDDVMVRLIGEMETSMRAVLAQRLAAVPNAPRTLVRMLARDEAIDVAGPVLAGSERLGEETLVETASTASQAHLLAISKRAVVSEAVSDVLVTRGDRAVALSTVANAGVRFSEHGHGMLVERSKDDDALAAGVWVRRDIPRQHLLKLFTVASENVRRTLETVEGQSGKVLREMLSDVAGRVQASVRRQSGDYTEARRAVAELRRCGALDEVKIREFAATGRFDETTVALAEMSDLPVDACERAMVQPRGDLVILLAKAIGLSWNTTKTILRLRDGGALVRSNEYLTAYTKLRPETARKAVQFLRLRGRAAQAQG